MNRKFYFSITTVLFCLLIMNLGCNEIDENNSLVSDPILLQIQVHSNSKFYPGKNIELLIDNSISAYSDTTGFYLLKAHKKGDQFKLTIDNSLYNKIDTLITIISDTVKIMVEKKQNPIVLQIQIHSYTETYPGKNIELLIDNLITGYSDSTGFYSLKTHKKGDQFKLLIQNPIYTKLDTVITITSDTVKIILNKIINYADYFPLNIGNKWVYKKYDTYASGSAAIFEITNGIVTHEIISMSEITNGKIFILRITSVDTTIRTHKYPTPGTDTTYSKTDNNFWVKDSSNLITSNHPFIGKVKFYNINSQSTLHYLYRLLPNDSYDKIQVVLNTYFPDSVLEVDQYYIQKNIGLIERELRLGSITQWTQSLKLKSYILN